MHSEVERSDNRILAFRASGHVVVAILTAAAYTMVTLPGGFHGGYGNAMVWFAIAETLSLTVSTLLAWSAVSFGLKYNTRISQNLGPWFQVIVLAGAAVIALSFCWIEAMIAGAGAAYEGTMVIKSFCLILIEGLAVVSSTMVQKLNAAEEQAIEPEAEPAAEEMDEEKKKELESVTVKDGTDIHIIEVSRIIYLKAEGDYVRIVTEEGSFLKEQTMKSFTQALPQKSFVRIHRSYIINSAYLRSIERYGDYQMVLMAGGEKIRISATGYRVLKDRLGL